MKWNKPDEIDRKVSEGARRAITRIYAGLLKEFPDGNFNSSFYKYELKEMLEILEDIARFRIRFGTYVIRNTWKDKRFGGPLQDLGSDFFNFLANGHPDGTEKWTGAENRDKRDTLISQMKIDPELEYENWAIHEMLGCFVRKHLHSPERDWD